MMSNEILRDTRFGSSFQFRNQPVRPTPRAELRRKSKVEKPKGAVKSFVTPDMYAWGRSMWHPVERVLGKPSFSLVEWKRCYSNEEHSVSIPWFWDHYDPSGTSLYKAYEGSEWSFYKLEHKYNNELRQTFMSMNQIGGFFNRLERSCSVLFGCMVVYGEDNDSGIMGAFFIRGQDHKPVFSEAIDWDLYTYSKLDPMDDQDRKFINSMWMWEEPVVINGQPLNIVDGKVFK